jgi:hypothetical protein
VAVVVPDVAEPAELPDVELVATDPEPAVPVVPELMVAVLEPAELPETESDIVPIDAEDDVPVVPEADTSLFVLLEVVAPTEPLLPIPADDPLLCEELQLANITARGNTINTFFITKNF